MIIPVEIERITSKRRGEKKIGEYVFTSPDLDWQKALRKRPKQALFCIVGIPESIGILGNWGRKGAEKAWEAFLKCFLNLQHNRFLSGDSFFVLGAIDVSDLQDQAAALEAKNEYYHQKLHVLCEELDERVEAILLQIIEAGALPIVIGGGHNNAYPLLKAASHAASSGWVNAINMDAHADFRQLEGRHSGNGFSYAFQKTFLNRYYVLGLHESYNSEQMLKSMEGKEQIGFSMFEDIESLQHTVQEAINFVADETQKIGIELDMDTIRYMPSSAASPSGFSLEQARSYIRSCASQLNPAYLHLPEAAPQNEVDARMVGKALAYLVSDFAKASLKKNG